MPSISLPSADFRAGENNKPKMYIAKEAINAGQYVYRSGRGEVKLAINTTITLAAAFGVAATTAALDGEIIIIPFGRDVTIKYSSAQFTAGETYILGDVAGEQYLAEEITRGKINTRIGVGTSTTELLMNGGTTEIAA